MSVRDMGTPLVGKREFPRPGTEREYYADPRARLDRWFQAANSSNVRTTIDIIRRLSPENGMGQPTRIVDPFAGAGSAALVARRMGIAFAGIELDPVLACVTAAKVYADRRLLRKDTEGRAEYEACVEVVRGARRERGPASELPYRSDLLMAGGTPHKDSRVVQGDATAMHSWEQFPEHAGCTVLYTSPPFGHTTVPAWSTGLVEKAEKALAGLGVYSPSGPVASAATYADLVAAMLTCAASVISRGLLILEHEPAAASEGSPEGDPVAIAAVLAEKLRSVPKFSVVDVLRTKNFSGKGTFSLIVCRMG